MKDFNKVSLEHSENHGKIPIKEKIQKQKFPIRIIPIEETTKDTTTEAKIICNKRSDEEIDNFAIHIISELSVKRIIESDSNLWYFDGRCYNPYGEAIIKKMCAKNNFPHGKVLSKIKNLAYIWKREFEIPKEYESFINLQNCVYDWRTNQTHEHNPRYNFKYYIPINYDRTANCPIFKGMISGMLANHEDIPEVLKWLGYHLMVKPKYQKSAFFVGPPATSKGKLLDVLSQLVGKDNSSAHTLKDLMNPTKYFVQDIENKLANISADQSTDKLSSKDIGIFLELVGEDKLSGRAVREKPITFKPKCKLTWAFNKFPSLQMRIFNGNEFWRRLIIFETKKYYIHDDPEFENELYKELPGIFNWIAEGTMLLDKEGFKNYKGDDGNYKDLKKMWIKWMIKESDKQYGVLSSKVIDLVDEDDAVQSDWTIER